MNRYFTMLIAVIFLSFCQNHDSKTRDGSSSGPIDCSPLPYKVFTDSVKARKFAPDAFQAKSDYLFGLVSKDIYCYWKGTPWAFYGMTRTPQTGRIACGYFVTNTLSDLGFKIERTRLAQVTSGEMIKVLCTDVHTFARFADRRRISKKAPGIPYSLSGSISIRVLSSRIPKAISCIRITLKKRA